MVRTPVAGQACGMPGPDVPSHTLPAGRLAMRALARRCPVCGQGRIFRRWFSMADRCPGCGLHFERERGHWTGHIGMNVIVSFGALLITLVVFALATWPELPTGPAIIAAMTVAVITPLAFFPWSRTLWLALDLVLNPLRPDELDPDAPRAVAVRTRSHEHDRGNRSA